MNKVRQDHERGFKERNPYFKFSRQCIKCGTHYRSDEPRPDEMCSCGGELRRENFNPNKPDVSDIYNDKTGEDLI